MTAAATQKFNRIKAALAAKGKTSKALAEFMNVQPQTVSFWCTNTRQPRLDELYGIAQFLGVSPCDLLEPVISED